MKTTRLIIIIAGIALLTNCNSKTFKPIYTAPPAITDPPELQLVKERKVPRDESHTLSFSLNDNAKPAEDDYFNNPGAKRSVGGRSPSVIIAPPKEIEVSGKKVREFEQSKDGLDKIFRTDGYYNEAEQAIEKALLRIGFDVLDRSKFEAKLRDLRDRANERPWWYSDWTEDLLESGEFDVLKDQYKKQLENGMITPQQYAEIITEVDNQSQRGLPGKKREEDEMVDIAEVIRAAQVGTEQADYLLQINEVTVADAGNRSLSLGEISEVQIFMNSHHGLKYGQTPRGIPSTISSNWLRASFNAKLIEVKSGSIVWIGSFEIESSAAEPIEISFDVDKNISNEDEVNGEIQRYNRKLNDKREELLALQADLNSLYKKASTEKKLETSSALEPYTNSLKKAIREKQSAYAKGIKELNAFLQESPLNSSKNWSYTYDVSDPVVYPNLLAIGKRGIQGQQRLLQHRKELINKVTQELIATIKIN